MEKRVPFYSDHPLTGCLRDYTKDRVSLYRRIYAQCGDLGAFRIGLFPHVLVSSAEGVREVLVEKADSLEKPPGFRKAFMPLLGNGLITCENASHRSQRKLVAPAFNLRNLRKYADEMVGAARIHAEGLRDGVPVDLSDEMNRLTLRIVGRTLFSVDLLGEAHALSEAVGVGMHNCAHRMVHPYSVAPKWIPTTRNRSTQGMARRLDRAILRMVRERQGSPEPPLDLLTSLIQACDEETGARLSPTQIRDEVMSLFIAGHETTATALCWSYYLLMQNPQVHAQLRDEVSQVLGSRPAAYGDFENLKYVTAVIKEAMRLYPPIHSIARRVVRDMTILEAPIKRGTFVVISPFVLHRRADYFPSPEDFVPERFLPERESAIPRQSYIPFGAGARSCIGALFATLEATLVLATLTQQVSFESIGGGAPELQPLLTLRARGGVPATVRRVA